MGVVCGWFLTFRLVFGWYVGVRLLQLGLGVGVLGFGIAGSGVGWGLWVVGALVWLVSASIGFRCDFGLLVWALEWVSFLDGCLVGFLGVFIISGGVWVMWVWVWMGFWLGFGIGLRFSPPVRFRSGFENMLFINFCTLLPSLVCLPFRVFFIGRLGCWVCLSRPVSAAVASTQGGTGWGHSWRPIWFIS